MRTHRHSVLIDLINQGLVRSQSDARKLLAKKGHPTTQATVSRDLEELGAIKVRDGDEIRYALGTTSPAFGSPLEQVLKNFVLSFAVSDPLIVIKTPPGHASMVAAALDRAKISGILGTVAGDDTLFVCSSPEMGSRKVVDILEQLMGEKSPAR